MKNLKLNLGHLCCFLLNSYEFIFDLLGVLSFCFPDVGSDLLISLKIIKIIVLSVLKKDN